jgi:hypothetical protein
VALWLLHGVFILHSSGSHTIGSGCYGLQALHTAGHIQFMCSCCMDVRQDVKHCSAMRHTVPVVILLGTPFHVHVSQSVPKYAGVGPSTKECGTLVDALGAAWGIPGLHS